MTVSLLNWLTWISRVITFRADIAGTNRLACDCSRADGKRWPVVCDKVLDVK